MINVSPSGKLPSGVEQVDVAVDYDLFLRSPAVRSLVNGRRVLLIACRPPNAMMMPTERWKSLERSLQLIESDCEIQLAMVSVYDRRTEIEMAASMCVDHCAMVLIDTDRRRIREYLRVMPAAAEALVYGECKCRA